MRRRRWLESLVVAVTMLATPTASLPQGSSRWVNATDATCQGHSPCYSTIQAAVNAAQAGDRIVIQSGTYGAQVNITSKNSGTGAVEADRIVIEADPAAPIGSVVLHGSVAQCTNGYAVRFQQSKFITVRGLTITGAGGQAVALLGGTNGNQAIHLERLRIFGNGSGSCDGGITVNRDNPGTLIANSLIYGNGRNGVSFLDADGGPHYLIGNTIHGNAWSGVNVARNHETWLVNNAITGNGTATGSTGGRFGVVRESSTSPQPAGIHLLNNLICGNRLGEISGPALDSTDADNLTPTGSEGAGVLPSPGCSAETTLYAAPLGADGVAGTADDDFRPAGASPGLDRGMDPRTLGLGAVLTPPIEADYSHDGVRPRSAGGIGPALFDIGAFELVPANRPPVPNAGGDRTVVEGTALNLDGSASGDPDGDTLSFAWTQTAGPTVTLIGATTDRPAFTAPAVTHTTILTFALQLSDGSLTATDTVNITVTPANRPPGLAPIGDKLIALGSTLAFTVTAVDPDDDALTFAVSPLPANAAFTPAGAFTFTPAADQVGHTMLTFSVSDGRGGTAVETITISVTSALQIVIASPVDGATVAEGMIVVRGTMQSGGVEVGVVVNGVAAAVGGTVFAASIPSVSGPNQITATATAAAATASHSITVAASGTATLTLLASPSIGAAPLSVSFALGGGVPDTVTLDLEGDGTVDFIAPELEVATFTYAQPGVYVPTATAIDADGNRASASTVVQVLSPSALDTLLRGKWNAMRDALRTGDIARAIDHIVVGARDGYATAFQAIAARLPDIDSILTDITFAQARGPAMIYSATRADAGVVKLFEVRFAIDTDGVWRVDSF